MCEQGHETLVRIAGGQPEFVDDCIAPLVDALNHSGIRTVASCCGHGRVLGNIVLADGRELFIAPDFRRARLVDRMQQENRYLRDSIAAADEIGNATPSEQSNHQ